MGASSKTSVSNQVNTRLPDELARELDEFCEENYGVAKSQVMRTALREFLENQ